ncbi:MAG: fused MFS/spermidine synthase [Aquabacterium sp.]|jgi:spermidine synthase|uniref:fused MFS/spermidine synthase n=1 Tax=Aquabacterium sp. TaxID=1872578 RepID=UPI002A36ACFE|nr:fused MFS/spermidine synthase [Aquabacterium sp.]MDX9842344.1 fused MFS/spermidine synthase [Aquabacterium sp.]
MHQASKPQVPAATLPSPTVEQDGESVIMSFDETSIQSRMRLDDPTALDLDYSRVMMAFLLLQPQPASILMIGLGGGSLAKYCHRHLPQARITVVEINPEVIAARDAFQVPVDGELFSVVQGDGAAFVSSLPRDSYDVILVDGFGPGGEQPADLCSLAFYKACRAALRASGVLMVNLQDKEPQCSRLIGRIWQMFGEPVVPLEVACGGNLVVLAGDDGAFRACAGNLRRRWRALDAVHQGTLDDVLPGLEEELKPWWTPPAREKQPVVGDGAAPVKPKVSAAPADAKGTSKKAAVQRKRSGGRR